MQSCGYRELSIEKIIEEYDTVDFRPLTGKSIYYRSRGHKWNTSRFFLYPHPIGRYGAFYVIDANNDDGKIVAIDNKQVLNYHGSDYYSKAEIEKSFAYYKNLRLTLVRVDSNGNVYINPSEQGEFVVLRKSAKSYPKDLRLYRHYKGDWYIMNGYGDDLRRELEKDE